MLRDVGPAAPAERLTRHYRYPIGVNFAQLLFPDFSLILCGYLVCRYTALNRRVWEQAEVLVYYFLFPVLLFHSIARSPLDLGEASSLIAAGLMLGLSGIAMAYSLPYLPWLGPAHRPARACGSRPDRLPLQLLHRAGAGRAAGRRARAAADRRADRRVRAAVQRGRRVADGPPWADRLRPRPAAQSADHRDGRRPGGESARCRHPALARTDAGAHRARVAGAGPAGGGSGHAIRQPGPVAGADLRRAVDPPLPAAAGGVRRWRACGGSTPRRPPCCCRFRPCPPLPAPMSWRRAWVTTAPTSRAWSRFRPCSAWSACRSRSGCCVSAPGLAKAGALAPRQIHVVVRE